MSDLLNSSNELPISFWPHLSPQSVDTGSAPANSVVPTLGGLQSVLHGNNPHDALPHTHDTCIWPSALGPSYCAEMWYCETHLLPTCGGIFSEMGDGSWWIQFFLFLLQHWLFWDGVVHLNFHTTVLGD